MYFIRETIEQDCEVLLNRALSGKVLTIFGEDGNGSYGRSNFPVFAKVQDVVANVINDDLTQFPILVRAQIFVSDYRATQYGLAITDENLRISLNSHFAQHEIKPNCWRWADATDQGVESISLIFDSELLLYS
jgi:hypothetical protein